jgi:hypothetical protein
MKTLSPLGHPLAFQNPTPMLKTKRQRVGRPMPVAVTQAVGRPGTRFGVSIGLP